MKICAICKQENRPPASFCRACGARLSDNTPAAGTEPNLGSASPQVTNDPLGTSKQTGRLILGDSEVSTGRLLSVSEENASLDQNSLGFVETGPLEMHESEESPEEIAASQPPEAASQGGEADATPVPQSKDKPEANDQVSVDTGELSPVTELEADEGAPKTIKFASVPDSKANKARPKTAKLSALPQERLELEAKAEASCSPLLPGSVIAERFQIVELLASSEASNLYLVYDLSACATCGSSRNQPQKRYCAVCGADSQQNPMTAELREALSRPALYSPDETPLTTRGEEIFYQDRYYLLLGKEDSSREEALPKAVQESTNEGIVAHPSSETVSESVPLETPIENTEPLQDADNEDTAPVPVVERTQPVPATKKLVPSPPKPLALGSLVAERYQIIALQYSKDGVNLYSASDLCSCASCGFDQNYPSDNYCWECGVERRSDDLLKCKLHEGVSEEAAKWANSESGFAYNDRFYLVEVELPPTQSEPDVTQRRHMTLSVGYGTHVGMIRQLNEDSLSVFTLGGVYESIGEPTLGLFIVADGLGGHDGGDVASKFVIQTITERLIKRVLLPKFAHNASHDEAIMPRLIESIRHANELLYNLAQERYNDMGCTLTMALVINKYAYIANVGDSRTYLYRNQQLQQITNDHSLIASLIAAGMAEPHEIYTHPERNVIYRSMGHAPDIEVDTWEQELKEGDQLLLCSDGLWETIHNEGIDEILATYSNPQAACDEMIHQGNVAGGEDNITVILVKVG